MSIEIQGSNSIAGMSVQGMDIETALLAVQSERASLLEEQLRGQLDSVSAKNSAIGEANEQLITKRNALAALEASNATDQSSLADLKLMKQQLQSVIAVNGGEASDTTGLGHGWADDSADASKDLLERVKSQGLTNVTEPGDIDGNGTMDATRATMKSWVEQIDAKISAIDAKPEMISSAKAEIENLKTGIDTLSNSQQMEMLRLQSLSNKRNEAFDVMTNFIKKMQDSRSSIIGNMR
jgi:chromosome segregation ATPase